ncbi:MAG: 3-deoxy-D-manno-octulosonic acid transferase [Yoonia sp.]|uniref:3-deoxy-D-manno-octulosonic acid transferase n=1 Tax=Yoonia sp. TaxID=2212373 RepID=UPI003EF92267
MFAWWQRRALASGKEDPARVDERWGRTGAARPAGRVVWFHAASVGETQSVLPLIDALVAARPDLHVLLTSTTRSSAQMLVGALPPRTIHQMAPYDTVAATRAFLDHWRPDVAVWVESELWPRMLAEAGRRNIPRLLMNARVSERTALRWQKFSKTAYSVLSQFDLIHVQEAVTQEALTSIGVTGAHVTMTGSLKQDRPPLAADPEELSRLGAQIGSRPVWCASSTHAGEEEMVLAAHTQIGGLLILVPRHVERASEIAQLCQQHGLSVAQRSTGAPVTDGTAVYLADTMGELGLWYRLAPVSFIGGSLAAVGGHNPYEAAQLDTAILHGPHIGNFATIYARLDAQRAALAVDGVDDLVKAVKGLTPAKRQQMQQSATAVLGETSGAMDHARDAVLGCLG